MTTMLYRRLFSVTADSLISFILSRRVFCKLHFGNVLSTEAHSNFSFSEFASSKLNLSEARINQILKTRPHLRNPQTLHNIEKIIYSLKKHGFTEAQIIKIMRSHPQIMGSKATIFESKLQLLKDFGFVDQNLVKLLTASGRILSNSIENKLLPTMEFLKNVFRDQDDFIKAVLRAPLLIFSLEKTLKPSLAFWERWDFRGIELVSFLRVFPAALLRTSLTPAQIDFIQNISAGRTGKSCKYVVGVVALGRMETLQANIENFKLCGLSDEEVWQLLGANPQFLKLSRENVNEKMKFIVSDLELPANFVVKHSSILKLNLEKTMRPRFLVWQKIKSINDVDLSPLKVFRMSEARFVSKVLEGHPESKTLFSIYESALSNASSRSKNLEKSKFWWQKSVLKNQNELLNSLPE